MEIIALAASVVAGVQVIKTFLADQFTVELNRVPKVILTFIVGAAVVAYVATQKGVPFDINLLWVYAQTIFYAIGGYELIPRNK